MRFSSKSKIGLALASVLFVFVCAELGARIWLSYFASRQQTLNYELYTHIDPRYFRFTPHPYLDYVLTPNFRDEWGTSHNSLGFRGAEFPRNKPPGEFRIVALGGSTTYDEDLPDNQTHTYYLEDILRHRYGYSNIRVINAGVPGYNSWESLVNLEFRVLDISPDLILHYDNNNDVHARLVNPSIYKGDDSAKRMAWSAPAVAWWEWSAIARILSRYLHYTRQMGIEDFVYTDQPMFVMNYDQKIGGDPMKVLDQNPPVYFERNTRNMLAIERAHGITPVLITWQWSPHFGDYTATRHYQKAYAQHNEVYKRLAAFYDVPLFDMEAVMPQDKEYYEDGRHSNPKGTRKRAELIAEFLTSHKLLPRR